MPSFYDAGFFFFFFFFGGGGVEKGTVGVNGMDGPL